MVALSSPWPSTDLERVDPSEESKNFFEIVRNYTRNDTKLHAGIIESSSYLACRMLIWTLYAVITGYTRFERI